MTVDVMSLVPALLGLFPLQFCITLRNFQNIATPISYPISQPGAYSEGS